MKKVPFIWRFVFSIFAAVGFSAFVQASASHADIVSFNCANNSGYYQVSNGTLIPNGQYSYSACTGDLTLDQSVTSIGSQGLAYIPGLTSITIPNTVTSIGDRAFAGDTGLTSIVIPPSVTSIGANAFAGDTNLTSITLSEGLQVLSSQAFEYDSWLTTITLPSTLTTIGTYAFAYDTGLTAITIPGGVSRVSTSAFTGDTNLASVTISRGVTSIDDYAFWNDSHISSITIPDTVTSIGSYSFAHMGALTSIVIPNSVTSIGTNSFSGDSLLNSVTISSGLSAIADNAFSNDSAIVSLVIPEGVTSIGNNSFSSLTGLTSVTLPSTLTSIGSSAFASDVNLTGVVLPNALNFLGSSAFSYDSALTSITVPGSLNYIGGSAFVSDTSLATVVISSGVTQIGIFAFSGDTALAHLTIPSSVSVIGQGAFAGDNALTCVDTTTAVYQKYSGWGSTATCLAPPRISLSNSSEAVHAGSPIVGYSISSTGGAVDSYSITPAPGNGLTFDTGTGLLSGTATSTASPVTYTITAANINGTSTATYTVTVNPDLSGMTSGTATLYCPAGGTYSVIMPAGVLSGNSSCAGDLTLDPVVKVIYTNAFAHDTLLTNVFFDANVTAINASAFTGTSIQSVTLPPSVTSVGANAFQSIPSLSNVTLDANLQTIGIYAFSFDNGITSITLPASLTSMGYDAFQGDQSLTQVVFATNGIAIPNAAFTSDPISTLTMPVGSVSSIGMEAFGSARLGSFSVPEGVTSVGDSAFRGSNLTAVTLPSTLTSIGSNAFSLNMQLVGITIPDSVTSIGAGAFSQDYALTTITLGAGLQTYPAQMLQGTLVTTLNLPAGLKTIAANAFIGMSNLSSLTIPNGVTTLGANLISGNGNISSIHVPSSVTSIDMSAFYNATSLRYLTIDGPITIIGPNFASNDPALTQVTFANTVTSIDGTAFNADPSLTRINYCGTASGLPIQPTCILPTPVAAFRTLSRTSTSMQIQITNYDPTVTYSISESIYGCRGLVSNGVAGSIGDCGMLGNNFSPTVSLNLATGVITLSNLGPLATSFVRVATSKVGHTTMWSSDPDQLETLWNQSVPYTPILINPVPTADGFYITIQNYYPTYNCGCGHVTTAITYTAVDSAGGTVSFTSNPNTLQVSGLAPGTSSTVTVYATPTVGSGAGAYVPVAAVSQAVTSRNDATPVFGPGTPTVDGFTIPISNFDFSYTYQGTNSAGGTVAVDNSGLVTVTGVPASTSSTVTLQTLLNGVVQGQATSQAFTSLTGTLSTPTFGTPITALNGARIQISNYDPSETYSITVSYAYTANIDYLGRINGTGSASSTPNPAATLDVGSGVITVTGIPQVSEYAVNVTVSEAGYQSATGSTGYFWTAYSGQTPFTPIFSNYQSTPDGYIVKLSNLNFYYYSGPTSYYYRLIDAAGGRVYVDGSTGITTVSGLAPGTVSTLTVVTEPHADNLLFPVLINTSNSISSLNLPLTPTFGAANSTSDGFTVQINNYDPLFTWSGTDSASGNVSISNSGLVTVSGLPPLTSSTVTISTNRSGFLFGSASSPSTSSLVGPALNPVFGNPTQTADGFTIPLSNFDSSYTWTGSATGTAVVTIDSTGIVTVSGLAPSTTTTLTITSSRSGYLSGSNSISSDSAIGTALVPIFGTPHSTSDGFTVQITNYDSNYSWSIIPPHVGSATISSSGLVTVTGLNPATSISLTVTNSRAGYANGHALVSSSSSAGSALNPIFGTSAATSDGFTVQITNYDSQYSWAGTSTAGGVVAIDNTGLVTVTGVASDTAFTVTVTTRRTGYQSGANSISSRTLYTPTNPYTLPAASLPTSDALISLIPQSWASDSVRRAAYLQLINRYADPSITASPVEFAIDPSVTSAALKQAIIVTANTTEKFWGNVMLPQPYIAVITPNSASQVLLCQARAYEIMTVAPGTVLTSCANAVNNVDGLAQAVSNPGNIAGGTSGGNLHSFSEIMVSATGQAVTDQSYFAPAGELHNQVLFGLGYPSAAFPGNPFIFGDGSLYFAQALGNFQSPGLLDRQLSPNHSGYSTTDSIDVTAAMRNFIPPTSFTPEWNAWLQQQYFVGSAASEFLIAQFGISKYIDWMNYRVTHPVAQSQTNDELVTNVVAETESTFAHVFGESWDTWAPHANQYLNDLNRGISHSLTYYEGNPSTDASLASLTVNGTNLLTSGSSVNVTSGTTSVTPSISTTSAYATAVVSGNTGLTTGNNTVTVTVTAEDRVTTHIYTFTINVAAPVVTPAPSSGGGGGGGGGGFVPPAPTPTLSKDATLSLFTVNGQDALAGGLVLSLDNGVTSAAVAATAHDHGAKAEVSGATNLQTGKNIITVKVTAPDGTMKNYTAEVDVAEAAPTPTPTPTTTPTPTPVVTTTPTPVPTPTPVLVATPMPTPSATPTTTNLINGTSVGGGITLVTHNQGTPVAKPQSKGSRSVANAPILNIGAGQPVEPTVNSLPKSTSVTVSIMVNGKSIVLGAVKTDGKGSLSIPTFAASKPGTYVVQMTTKTGAKYYLDVVVKGKGK